MDDGIPEIKRDDRVSKRRCVGFLLLMLVGIGVIAFVYFQFHPRDRVVVTIKNVPAETRFLCIVAETDEGIRAMNWSRSNFEMEPRDCAISYVINDGHAIPNQFVMWRFGSRYGVITRHPEKVWRVHWFQAEDMPLEGRSFLVGEGTAVFDMLKAKTEQPAAEVLRGLGIDDIHFVDNK